MSPCPVSQRFLFVLSSPSGLNLDKEAYCGRLISSLLEVLPEPRKALGGCLYRSLSHPIEESALRNDGRDELLVKRGSRKIKLGDIKL